MMMTSQSGRKMTALHYACYGGAYFNVIKMLIDIGGEELVVVKDSGGDTAVHTLSRFIHDCDNAADKIKLLIEVAGTEIILTEKNKYGKTPLDLATAKGTSDEIKALFQPRTIKNEPEISSNDASNFVPDDLDNDTVITELQQDQLQAAKQKIADLETQKTEHRKTIADLETEIVLLHEQNMKHDKDNTYWKDRVDNLTKLCSDRKVELQELKDSTRVSVANARRERDVECSDDADQDQDDSSSHARASKRSRIGSSSISAANEMDVEEDDAEAVIQELLHEKQQHIHEKQQHIHEKQHHVLETQKNMKLTIELREVRKRLRCAKSQLDRQNAAS